MPELHASEEELILHYYGELLDTAVPARAEHIDSCPHCRMALQELGEVLALVERQAMPEPLTGLEQRVWARLLPALSARPQRWWERVLESAPRRAVASGVAVVVVMAFFVGRFSGPVPEREDAAVAVMDPAVAADRLMHVAVGDHLDQSQMVLLELLNGSAAGMSIEGEQERARDLVAANRLYRHTALQAGNEGVREVLDALERVLIEIANAPPDVSARELEALRAEIEQRGILFRLRVVSSEMRAREQNLTAAAPSGP